MCLMIGQLVLSFLFLSTHIVYWMQAYSSMYGQCNTVRRLLRLYVLTCWMGTYRLFWAIVSMCSCLFYLVVACSEAVWFVQWIKHLGTGLGCCCSLRRRMWNVVLIARRLRSV